MPLGILLLPILWDLEKNYWSLGTRHHSPRYQLLISLKNIVTRVYPDVCNNSQKNLIISKLFFIKYDHKSSTVSGRYTNFSILKTVYLSHFVNASGKFPQTKIVTQSANDFQEKLIFLMKLQ